MPELNFLWLLFPFYIFRPTNKSDIEMAVFFGVGSLLVILGLLCVQYSNNPGNSVIVGNILLPVFIATVLYAEKENITQDMWIAGILLLTSLCVFFI